MLQKLTRAVKAMPLEEQILHVGLLASAIGVFLPWFGGQSLGLPQLWTGLGFHTKYIGAAVLVLQLFMLAMTASPLVGGPIIVRRSSRHYVRVMLSALSTILLVAAFSVLFSITSSDMPSGEIWFGMYVSIVGTSVALLYSSLLYREQLRTQVQELFHHPDEPGLPPSIDAPKQADTPLPPPPPPVPPPIEDHHLVSRLP